jgi:DNA-binding SARP family transcriptional activator
VALAKPWRDVRVYLTGDICLVAAEHVVRADALPGRQGRIAAAHLLLERSRPIPRDELADVLWPSALPPAYDVALSAVVSKLRAAFATLGLPRDTLSAAGGCYEVRLPAGTWVDVEAAIEGVHLAEGALLAGRPGDAYGPAVVAGAILRRPFLPGADGPWIEARQRSLRAAQVRALDCLAEIHEWNGEHALALRAAREGVDLEPYRESGYRRLMRLHQRAGDAAEAVRVFEELAARLHADLGVSPSPETAGMLDGLAPSAKTAEK